MSTPLRLLTLLLATTVGTSCLTAAEKLTMKFREGEKYGYLMRQDMEMVGENKGQQIRSEMRQKLNLSTLIKSVDEDGNAVAEQTIERVRMKIVLPAPINRTIEVDTASEAVPKEPSIAQMAAGLSKTVGKAMQMTMTPSGEITDVVIPESIRETQQQPGSPVSGDQIEQMMKQSGFRLPEEEISKGHTWDQEVEMKMPDGTMSITTTFTYQGKNEDGLHQIDAVMDTKIVPAEDAPNKVTAKPKEGTGTFLFDNEIGKLTRSDVTQVIEVEQAGAKQTVTTRVTMILTDGSIDDPDDPSEADDSSDADDSPQE
jgi:hypothetical protein